MDPRIDFTYLDPDTWTADEPCCPPSEHSACCDPDDKAECCGTSAGEVCGCR